MHLYQDQFSEKHDFPRRDRPSKVLIIASTPRCGSHMLGHTLYKANSFGFPLEYANSHNLAEWNRRFNTDNLSEALAEIQQRRTSPNGVFSIKVHYSHIKQFGRFRDLQKLFPDAYYILLRRRDVLSQAISLSIAQQTGVWISGQESICDVPQYDFDRINSCLRRVILATSSWQYALSANGCNYIEMDFEYIRQNISKSIQDVADFLNIEFDLKDMPISQVTKKQSGRFNAEWRNQFLADFTGAELLEQSSLGTESSSIGRVKSKLSKILHS